MLGSRRSHTPVQMSPAPDSDSLESGSSAPGIRLEPPSPDRERRSHLRSFSDMMEVSVQSPSTTSVSRSTSLSPSPPPSYDERAHANRSPSPMSSNRLSEPHTIYDTPSAHTHLSPNLPEGRILLEATPSDTPRYNRQRYVPNDTTTFTVSPVCFTFPQ